MKNFEKAFGPLWNYINDDSVKEVFVDAHDDVYYEGRGEIINVDNIFKSQDEVSEVANTVLREAGIELKEGRYNYEFSIDQYTIVNIVLAPMALTGTVIQITKIPKRVFSWQDMRKAEAVDEEGEKLIKELIASDKNLLVAGSVGSGKTTLLNLLVNTIDPSYRIVTIEKTPSLIIQRKRTARLQSPYRCDQELKDMVIAAADMRADSIILNEIYGPETMEYLNLLLDGHHGMALMSADNIFDVLKRLELKALSSDFSGTLDNIRYAIAQAFDAIVFQEKCDDGKRRITNVAEITYEDGRLGINIIYRK